MCSVCNNSFNNCPCCGPEVESSCERCGTHTDDLSSTIRGFVCDGCYDEMLEDGLLPGNVAAQRLADEICSCADLTSVHFGRRKSEEYFLSLKSKVNELEMLMRRAM